MSGQQIGTVVGGLVGAYFGYPQLGAAIGGYIGGVIDPTIIKGPSIGDAQQQTSQAGMPIPKCFGHCAPIAPTLIDGDPIARKIKQRHDVGKGATTKTETEGFLATRAFLVCEGEIAGYARITRNGKLVYSTVPGDQVDGDSVAFANQLTIYTGTETQGPDPSLEAIHGVGNTPYYRGRSYFVVRDDDETQTQGAANQYRVEVISGGTYACEETVVPWIDGNTGTIQSIFGIGIKGTTAITAGWNDNLRRSTDGGRTWNAVEYMASTGWAYGDAIQAVWHDSSVGNDAGAWYIAKSDKVAISYSDGFSFFNYLTPVHLIEGRVGPGGGVHIVAGTAWAGAADLTNTVIFQVLNGTVLDLGGNYGRVLAIGDIGGSLMIGTSAGDIRREDGTLLHNVGTDVVGFAYLSGITLALWGGGGYSRSTDSGVTWTDFPGSTLGDVVVARTRFYGCNGSAVYISQDGITWDVVDSSFAGSGASALIATDGYSVLAAAQAGQTAALPSAYIMPDVANAYLDESGNVVVNCAPRIDANSVMWKEIALEIALRASPLLPAHMDVDIMTDEVPGFVLGNQTLTGTDYLRTLCTFYFTDLPEYDGQLHAIRRGGPIVATFTADDLLAVEEGDDDTRSPALEAFKRLTVVYPDPANNYVTTPQTAPRTSPDITANNEISLQCPIPFDADTVAQKADILQKIAFLQVEGGFKRALPAEFSKYVPSDAIMFNDRRHIITKASNDDSMVQFECTYDRPSAYTSNAKGSSGRPPQPQASNLKGPTVFAAMNLPSLRTADNVPGMYLAATGILDGWPGASILLSVDEGETYVPVMTIFDEATMGALAENCDSGATDLISVDLLHGHEVASVTTAQIAAKANAFAVTSAGVAEIGQFQTAMQDSNGHYDLTDITRPELGTTAAPHYKGDRFVILDGNIRFLPLDASLAGKTLWFRPVTLGTAAANNPIYKVVFRPQFTSAAPVSFLLDETGDPLLDETGAYLAD